MGINTLYKFLIVYFLVASFISCKGSQKRDNNFSYNSTLKVVKEEAKNKEQNKKDKLIDFVEEFYKSYLTYLNDDVDECDLTKYLSKDFITYVNKQDYDAIITGQDYEKFDLNTLKVSKTKKNKVYKVEFVNMGYETTVYPKLEFIESSYKIIQIARKIEDINEKNYISNTNKYDFDLLNYIMNSHGDRTQITFSLEDYSNRVIFTKGSYDENFEYFCLKKKTDKGLELYYKEDSKYDEYIGDKNKPLITIYKKGEDFYAKSPLIKDGKEIKLKEE